MKKAQEVKAKPKKHNRTSSDFLKQELFSLVVKLAILLTLAYFVVHFVYGITRYPDDSMVPAVKSSDVVALEYENDLQLRRVVAIEGDTVNITEEGLEINNHLQAEHQIYEETLPYTEGIDYPVKIGAGEVFVLGDKREAAIDSRVYGPIKTKDTLGKVITILRRRSI